jgi:hypothetical protein
VFEPWRNAQSFSIPEMGAGKLFAPDTRNERDYLQSGRPAAAAGRFSTAELVDEPAPAEVEVDPLELPLCVLGDVVVVLVLPIWVFVMSRTCLVALSQHLPWLTLVEGEVVVVVL